MNYFRYEMPPVLGDEPLVVNTELAVNPWTEGSLLLRVSLIGNEKRKTSVANHIVLVADISENMKEPQRLQLMKSALRKVVNKTKPDDRLSIIGFSDSASVLLPAVTGAEKSVAHQVVEHMTPGGKSNGAGALNLAYQLAEKYKSEGGNSVILLVTNGDFNAGQGDNAYLFALASSFAEKGIYLKTIGLGASNLKENRLYLLAKAGKGNYSFIDNHLELDRTSNENWLHFDAPVAESVKLQVEFNPALVQAYRLVGYEGYKFWKESFTDDTFTTGNLDAGQMATVLYEILPQRLPFDVKGSQIEPLRYQEAILTTAATGPELALVKAIYRIPGQASFQKSENTIINRWSGWPDASDNFRWAASVAGLTMLLKDSPYVRTLTWEKGLEFARLSRGKDLDGERTEFIRLLQNARLLAETQKKTNAKAD